MNNLIYCRDCGSPSCIGCNIKTLDDLLENGVLDKFMNEHYDIRKEKIVNAVPVVHSEWEITEIDHAYGKKCYHCPECGTDEWRYDYARYCPNCGAKMD